MKNLLLIFSVLLMLTFAACVSHKTQAFDKTYPEPTKKIIFPKIKEYNALLERVSPIMEFKAGTSPAMTFRLMNLSTKRLILPEWMMNEPDNLIIYYIPWEKGMKKPPIDKWQVLAPKTKLNPKRMTLDLNHRNSVLIKSKLTFIKDMKIRTPKDFLLFGALNLTSIRIKSRIMKIRINP